jgi:hypothetical protein
MMALRLQDLPVGNWLYEMKFDGYRTSLELFPKIGNLIRKNATGRWMVVARRVEAANVSDRRMGGRLLAGLQSGFPRIRTVMANAGYESRKLARELKRCHGWRLYITERRLRAFKVVGLTWIIERSFAWLTRNRRLSKDYELKVQLRKPSSTSRPFASCSNGSPRGKTSQTPS